MDYTVEPGKGVGPLLFGIKRDTVHKILGEPEETPKRGENTYDLYSKLGIAVNYTPANTLALVDFYGPAAPVYKDTNLMEVKDPGEWLQDQDEETEATQVTFTSEKLNIVVYTPNPTDRVVGVFMPGYYGD